MRPEVLPPILVTALREGMLRLAGREADGAIINWLAANDVPKVTAVVAGEGDGKEIVARIFVCPRARKRQTVHAGARRATAAYLNVPVYALFPQLAGTRARVARHVGHVARR